MSSTSGAPLPGAVVDVWHAAANGRYEHEDPAQPEWNLRGQVRADAGGAYRFETVVPAPYEITASDGPVGRLLRAAGRPAFRPAHLHYKVSAEGHRPLTTQVFVAGDPWLDCDVIESRMASSLSSRRRTGGGSCASTSLWRRANQAVATRALFAVDPARLGRLDP